MNDIELILRFFALSDRFIEETTLSSISLKEYLNKFMGARNRVGDTTLENMKDTFVKTMNFILRSLGKEAFNNISDDGVVIKKFHPTIYDAISIATTKYITLNSDKVTTNG